MTSFPSTHLATTLNGKIVAFSPPDIYAGRSWLAPEVVVQDSLVEAAETLLASSTRAAIMRIAPSRGSSMHMPRQPRLSGGHPSQRPNRPMSRSTKYPSTPLFEYAALVSRLQVLERQNRANASHIRGLEAKIGTIQEKLRHLWHRKSTHEEPSQSDGCHEASTGAAGPLKPIASQVDDCPRTAHLEGKLLADISSDSDHSSSGASLQGMYASSSRSTPSASSFESQRPASIQPGVSEHNTIHTRMNEIKYALTHLTRKRPDTIIVGNYQAIFKGAQELEP